MFARILRFEDVSVRDSTGNVRYPVTTSKLVSIYHKQLSRFMMAQTCLIVEADPFIARLLHRFAEVSGLQAVQVQGDQDVITLVHQLKPILVILEPELPGKVRGWDLIRKLRQDKNTQGIPIITCSWRREEDVTQLVGQVQGNLLKPDLHFEDFQQVLERAGIHPPPHSSSALEETRPAGS